MADTSISDQQSSVKIRRRKHPWLTITPGVIRTSLTATSVLVIIVGVLLIYHLWPRTEQFLQPLFSPPPEKELMAALQSQNLSIELPLTVSGNSIAASISGTTVLFSQRKDFRIQARALQLVLMRIKMDTKAPREIDLRFDKVVLRY